MQVGDAPSTVRTHGNQPCNVQWFEIWTTACDLCSGYHSAALDAGILFAHPDVLRFLFCVQIEQSWIVDASETWRSWMTLAAGRPCRMVIDVVMEHTPLDMSSCFPLEPRKRLTLQGPRLVWRMAEEATRHHNHIFLEWFLTHPEAPIATSHSQEAQNCVLAAIGFTYKDSEVGTLTSLQVLRRFGVVAHGWLHDAMCRQPLLPGDATIPLAIQRSTASVVRWLFTEGPGLVSTRIQNVFLLAVARGDVHIFETLREFIGAFNPTDALLIATAAEMGNVEMMQYLHNRGCVTDHRTLQFALMNNHIHAAKWALDHHSPLYAGGAVSNSSDSLLREWILAQIL